MPTARQKVAAQKVVENRGNVSRAMLDAGYSPNSAKNPKNLTDSKGWEELMAEFLSDEELQQKHRELLNATKVEHMTFPLGPQKTETQQAVVDKLPDELKTILDAEMAMASTDLSDEDIIELLKTVSCTVQRIVHGQTARHVYYWAADSKARKDALDMAYKLKGRYATEKVDITSHTKEVTIDDGQFDQLIRAAAARSIPAGPSGSAGPTGATGSRSSA